MLRPTLAQARPNGTLPTALTVDGNETSRRFVELALGRSFTVEAAHDAESALEILKVQPIDMIVCDNDLSDMNGLAFFRRLSRESRLRTVPFVFLSADRSVETRVAAIRAGVDDYIVKPCDVAELLARAEALVNRQRRARETSRHMFSLAGDLSVISLPDVIGIIEMGRRTGLLSIVTSTKTGRLHFDGGRMVHAVYGNIAGEEAFHRLFRETTGQFEFSPGAAPPEEITIDGSLTGLILEAARRFDTEAASSTFVRLSTLPPPNEGAPAPARTPMLMPSAMLAAQFELAIQDPFTLGELSVWNERDLAAWTRSAIGRDRFHVVLVAALPVGVASILSLAGAPTERCILDSLSPERKAFGITFFLRHERILDVLLVDAADPTAFLPSLERMPSALVVCPPGGNILGMGTGPRVGLERLLTELCPPAVVAVGDEPLARSLSQLEVFQQQRSILRRVSGRLGETGAELRTLFVEAIRLWAKGGAGTGEPPPVAR